MMESFEKRQEKDRKIRYDPSKKEMRRRAGRMWHSWAAMMMMM
jgi:hypothetical protein